MLDKMTMPLTAKQIAVMDKNNKFDYNHLIQRGLVWERSRKSALIESMILGYPIPQIYCRRDRLEPSEKKTKSNSRYIVMDGKQRLTTISEYIQDEWKLSTLPEITYLSYTEEENSVNISNMLFSELPEELQDKIKDTSISFVCFENITPEEEKELFRRLNAGKPLSTKARLLSNCNNLEHLMKIGEHPIFTHMMTENAISQKNHISVLLKMWMMIHYGIEDVSFESKYFNPIVSESYIDESEEDALKNIFNYAEAVRKILLEKDDKKIAKKFYTETHLVSFVPWINIAVTENIDTFSFADFVVIFFKELSEDSDYITASTKGSAKNQNIQIRDEAISNSFNRYFIPKLSENN